MPMRCFAAFAFATLFLGASAVFGQTYPNKLIRVVASGIGGQGDVAARLISPALSDGLGQPVIVDNRPSLASIEAVSKAPPDGYTLLVAGTTFWIGPLLQKEPYDPVNDFLPISLLGSQPNILVVHPSLPVKSIKELIALAKARPGELNFASGAGVGSSSNLAGELFKALAGVKIVRIAYKSNSQQQADMFSGEVQLTFGNAGSVLPHIKSGRLKALAVTTSQPSPLVPGLPTIAASLPGYESAAATGLFAPAKTPAAFINRLNQEVVRVLNQPSVKQKFFEYGAETVVSSPEGFAAKIKTEMTQLAKVFKDAGIKAE